MVKSRSVHEFNNILKKIQNRLKVYKKMDDFWYFFQHYVIFCSIFSFLTTANPLHNRRFVNDTKNTQNRTLAAIGTQKNANTSIFREKKF